MTTTSTAGRSPWVASRVSVPVADLGRSLVFYRDLLGLEHLGGFAGHDGYDGEFLGLPGGGELELVAGGNVRPEPTSAEDLLVLYVADRASVDAVLAELAAAGVATVRSENPYWDRWGRTVVDPDGYRVVIAAVDSG